jgi:hypothetical protein
MPHKLPGLRKFFEMGYVSDLDILPAKAQRRQVTGNARHLECEGSKKDFSRRSK